MFLTCIGVFLISSFYVSQLRLILVELILVYNLINNMLVCFDGNWIWNGKHSGKSTLFEAKAEYCVGEKMF